MNSEYCLLWIDHWTTCMPRVEWSAWAQAIGAILSMVVAVGIALQQARGVRKTQFKHVDLLVRGALGALEHHVAILKNLTSKQIVPIDSKFLRDAISPFDGVLSFALPARAVAKAFATRQLLLTFANCIDDWRGKAVENCASFKFQLDRTENLIEAIRQDQWEDPS
jgi:hypothetical protein